MEFLVLKKDYGLKDAPLYIYAIENVFHVCIT